MVRRLYGKWRPMVRWGDQRGVTLVEVIVSVALMAVLGVSLLEGLSTSARSQWRYQEQVGALLAGRVQVEEIKKAAYDTSVTATPAPAYTSLPNSYTVGNIPFELSTTARLLETDLQEVKVTISSSGREMTSLQFYKARR